MLSWDANTRTMAPESVLIFWYATLHDLASSILIIKRKIVGTLQSSQQQGRRSADVPAAHGPCSCVSWCLPSPVSPATRLAGLKAPSPEGEPLLGNFDLVCISGTSSQTKISKCHPTICISGGLMPSCGSGEGGQDQSKEPQYRRAAPMPTGL